MRRYSALSFYNDLLHQIVVENLSIEYLTKEQAWDYILEIRPMLREERRKEADAEKAEVPTSQNS